MKGLAFLIGPTAVGKTSVGISLAESVGAEILSVDARQIYKELSIGTAKPTPEECCRVAHHLIDLYEPRVRVSAADFAGRFRQARTDLFARGIPGLAVGGSGLYVDACLGRLDRMPPADEEIRSRHAVRRDREGSAALHAELSRLDPQAAKRISPNDFKRISRALEVWELTGRSLSAQQSRPGTLDLAGVAPMVLLSRDREDLNARISERADAMIAAGLLDEVARLLAMGLAPDCPAFESIGYVEFARVIAGEISLGEAREVFVRRTRRYAKRQLTWFRNRYAGVREVAVSGGEFPRETALRCRAALGDAWANEIKGS